MNDLLSHTIVAGGVIMIMGAVQRWGELLAEGGWGLIRAETVERDNQEENKRILEVIKRKEEKLEQKEQRIERKSQQISDIKEEKGELEDRLTDFERITRSLKQDSIAREHLIERYWKPLHAVIICFAEQESQGESDTWLRRILEERYSLHNLTGFTYIVPPADVPNHLKEKRRNRDELKTWIEHDLYSEIPEAKSTICFAGVVDLRNVYSRTDYDQDDRSHLFSTIDEELDLEDIFNQDDFSKLLASDGVNLAKVIEEGDLPFLASKVITSDELDQIHENQERIEGSLGNPNLRKIATEIEVGRLSEVLEPYVADPDEVASSVKEEAKIWKRELYQ